MHICTHCFNLFFSFRSCQHTLRPLALYFNKHSFFTKCQSSSVVFYKTGFYFYIKQRTVFCCLKITVLLYVLRYIQLTSHYDRQIIVCEYSYFYTILHNQVVTINELLVIINVSFERYFVFKI